MADLLVPIPYDLLSIGEPLAYDIYSQAGEALFLAGHTLSPHDLQPLKSLCSYRRATEIPKKQDVFNHEGYKINIPTDTAASQSNEKNQALENSQHGNLLQPAILDTLHRPLSEFWERLQRGATPDIALCEVVRDNLVASVTNQVDQIQFLSQIRIRDEFTYSHILDVTSLSIALATKAGFSRKEVKEIALAALLHDLGKLLIPRTIMFKPSRLNEKEFQVMQLHPELGYKMIVEQLRLPDHIARPAFEHQEMYGGGGYPQGLSKNEMHPYSHVVKVADVYDALTSKRPYKESIPSHKALNIMLSEGSKSFHPELLAAFTKLANHYDPTRVNVA